METIKPDGTKYIKHNNFDLKKSVLFSNFQIIDKAGNMIEEKKFSQRLYTPLELSKLLENSGFQILKIYGDFNGSDLSLDLPQIITIAQK